MSLSPCILLLATGCSTCPSTGRGLSIISIRSGMQVCLDERGHSHHALRDLFKRMRILRANELPLYDKAGNKTGRFQKEPEHDMLDGSRFVIIDDALKYKGAKWEEHVVRCMWPPPDVKKDYQRESADAFEYGGEDRGVPVLRILCRLLNERCHRNDFIVALKEVTEQMTKVVSLVGFLSLRSCACLLYTSDAADE